MERRRVKQTMSLDRRLAQHIFRKLREAQPATGSEREKLIRKARQLEAASGVQPLAG